MIVGTAGHVDHGKTALVQALTGVDTDRLKEEKARGITIDLGFAYMAGPDGGTIGFVDVPGHERLVRTMVAGAAGIDFAILAIAADDGIMPQTREHLEILGLLGLARGVVAVTKCDRVDADRRAAVAAEIAGTVVGTPFAGGDPAFVSARSGEGIDALRRRLGDEASRAASRPARGLFRLPVDRAFTLTGVGTIVTGTALQGKVRVGDDIVVLPGRRRARVRSLHAQNREADEGVAGERLALALSGPGIDREVATRGAWICAGAEPAATARFDADLRLLSGEPRSLRDGAPVHLHVGASDGLARVVVLDGTVVAPGAGSAVQIVLDAPLPLRHGDLFVLRDASAQRTIGGGRVLDPRAPLRRRRTPERLARLDALRPADPAAALARLLAIRPGFEDLAAFRADRGLTEAEGASLRATLALELFQDGLAAFVATPASWTELRGRVDVVLADFHAANPELPGLAGERLRLLLGLTKTLFPAVRARLLAEKRVALRGHWVHLPGHVAELGAEDKRLAELVRPRVAAERFKPPRVRDIGKDIGIEEGAVRRACKALARTGDLVEVAHDHFFQRATVAEMAAIARALSGEGKPFSAADFRDRLDNGRKVAIQILEFFDRHGLTRRDGDLRRVVKAPELVFGAAEVG